MTPKQRRAFNRAAREFARATEGMTDQEIDDDIRAIVAEVRRQAINRPVFLFTDSAKTTELVWAINTRADR